MALICKLTRLNGTPVFVLPPVDANVVKRVFGATFWKPDGIWLFPAFFPYCNDVVRDLKLAFPEIEFDDKVTQHLEEVAKESQLNPDFNFVTKPYEHQKEALHFILKNLRCGIFYDMGLGKTKIIIDLIRHEKKQALVLSPVVGLGTWLYEVHTHSDDQLIACTLTGTPKTKDKILDGLENADILIATYDTAKLYQERIFEKFPYEIIIADESHNLRDIKTARTKAALALSTKAPRRIIMSGTPALGNPLHLYGQLAFLGKYIPAKDYWTFRKHHLITAKHDKHIVVGFKNLDMLNEKLHRVSLVKTKDECLDLPERVITDIFYDVTDEQRKMYNDMVAGILVELENGELYEPDHAATRLQKLLQILSGFMILPAPPICDNCKYVQACVKGRIKPYTPSCIVHPEVSPRAIQRMKANPKLGALNDLLDNILDNPKNKVIIWCNFIEELNIVQEALIARKVGFIRVDGSNSNQAQELAKQFNETPYLRVYLAQIATGVAITLNSAAYTIYFGLDFRLDHYLQSMDRNYRIGQGEKVFVYRLLVRRSVLAFLAFSLAAKIDVATALTRQINCAVCVNNETCAKGNVEPFTKGCLYPNKVDRKIIRAQKL